MKHYVGMDLHSNNTYIGAIDENDQRVFKGRFPNQLPVILEVLEAYHETITGIVVESTFNWYWLVDGLMDAGYKVHLAHPGAITQYNGLKKTDDKSDAFFLALLLKLGILPEGTIFAKEDRQIRDLMRKRLMLVRNKTQHLLIFKSIVSRNLGENMNAQLIKKLKPEDVESMFDNKHLVLSAQSNISAMIYLEEQIKILEKQILKDSENSSAYQNLITVPGIGKILGLTIALETGNINRFKDVGNYVSYCRCVRSERFSNQKKKGNNNRKNGNKFLSWAFIEVAHKTRRYLPQADAFYKKKSIKKNKIVAIKALSHKIARACFHMMKNEEPFNVERVFGKTTKVLNNGCDSKPSRGLVKEPLAPIGQTVATNSLNR